MKRVVTVSLAFVLLAVLAGCRGKDDQARLLSGSAGVKTMGMGSFYEGAGDWESAARKAYDVQQPTPPSTPAAAPAPAAPPAPATK